MKLSADGLKQYRAVVESAGLLDLSSRGKVEATGPDRVSFLHAMISNDVVELDEFAGRYATFLTATGKMVADFHFYKLPESILIDLDRPLAAPLMEALGKYIIMDDVSLRDASEDWGHLSLQGPRSPEIAAEFFKAELSADEGRMTSVNWEGGDGWLIRRAELSSEGCEVFVAKDGVGDLKKLLLSSFAGRLIEIEPDARNVLRVERVRPLFGVDMDAKNYPMEARLNRAISFTKGCYVGQEVVAKATYVGGVGRLLTPLKFEGEAVPEPGAAVFSDEGKTIGTVTSAVFSPRLKRAIALAYVKRTMSQPGNRFSVEIAGGRATAEAAESFLPE